MGTGVLAIGHFLGETLGARLGVVLCSMIPIIELRGGIPLGMALGLSWWESFWLAVIGNMLPVPLILLFVNRVIERMSRSRIKFLERMGRWLTQKAEKNRGRIENYAFFGVCVFVAIPLPMTGAWTGSLVAATVGMKFWKALLSCFLGVLAAATLVSLICCGVFGALSFLL